MVKRWFRKLQDEQGNVLILVSLGLAALMGFSAIVMDYGAVAVERRRMVNAADAAALAGAQELILSPDFPALAQARAVEYAVQNGVDPSRVTAVVSPGNSGITVEVENGVSYLFARVFGETGTNVRARARAVVGPAGGLFGIAPFSIVEQPLQYGVKYSLKYSDWKDSGLAPGNYGALALGGSGASRYRENIKEGYSTLILIGDLLEPEEGNMSGPTSQGIGDIFNEGCVCTLADFKPGCPLLIYIPVIRYLPANKKVEVVSFAAFFLDKDNPPKPGNENVVTGTFVQSFSAGLVDLSNPSYGVYAANLVE